MNIIIGAGVSGLSYAAFSKEKYRIIEATNSIGGYCKTTKRNGFTWDYSGHFFHFRDEHIKNYVFERMAEQKIHVVEKNTKIKYKENYIDFPFQKNIHQLEKDEYIECLIGLIERNNIQEPSNFKDFVLNTFGKAISEKFLIPYNEKLYACDLNKLDSNAMGRFFPHADFKEIILNARKKENNSYNNQFLYPEGGAIEFVKAIANEVDTEAISFNEKIIKIDPQKHEVITSSGKKINYNKIISTIQLPKLYELCGLAYDKHSYTSNSVAVFNIGFDSSSNFDHHWVYFPSKEISFYRIGYYNNILSQSRMSLYVEVGLRSGELVDKQQLFNQVVSDLKKEGIISNQKIVDWDFILMDPAYVHINEYSEKDKINKKQYLKDHDIYSIGRYGSWTYCSIEDNIIEAKSLAEENEKQ